MIKKSLLFLPISLLFVACNSTKEVEIKHAVELKPNEVIISYDEYKRLYENQEAKKIEKKKIVYEPIITPEEYKKMIKGTDSKANSSKSKEIASHSKKNKSKAFMDFYHDWKNVKYKFGGNSRKGIDCSAFTQRVFKEKFNVNIPRSTRTQVTAGKEVKKSNLKVGDLVFFKTGKIDRHVGIYMGEGKFMHASIKGIKFTKLDKPFYKKAYWTSRRIID
jgi:murein DD-endopeptidase / murein LD-carboxypeptidase